MQQAPVLLLFILNLSAILSAFLAAWAHLHAKTAGAREFFWMMLCVSIYSIGYSIEISHTEIKSVLQAIRIEYLGLAFIAVLILLFVLRFLREKPLPGYLTALLLLIPAISMIMVLTLNHHDYFYVNPRIVRSDFFPALDFEAGIWYIVNAAYMLTVSILSMIILLAKLSGLPRKKRQQAITIFIGSMMPIVGEIIYFLGFIPGNLDPGPFTMAITGVIFWIALFKQGLFELVPAARELALDSIRDIFLVINKQGRLVDLNQAAWQIPDAKDLKIGENLPPENQLVINLQPLLRGEQDEIEFLIDTSEAIPQYFQARSYPLLTRLSHADGMAVLISNITETTSLMKQLSYYANTDALTGVFNRRQLMILGAKEMERLRRSHLPFGVILADLDHFKRINDRYGHVIGDEVLKNAVNCFRKGLRDVDILGRYGGEEFVIFLPGTEVQVCARIAERLRKQLEECEVVFQGKRINVTASFGVHAMLLDENTTIDLILSNVDIALYQAKSAGRNQVAVYTSEVLDS